MDVAQTGAGFIPGFGGALSTGIGTARRAFGLGAYGINTNDLIQSGGNTFKAPSFGQVSDTGAIVITNREYIGNVYAPDSSDFSIQTYALNPGMAETFSWLSQIAANYDNYWFGQLIFTFKSTVSDFTTSNGVVGQVIMTTQYNSSMNPFTDKQQMMTYHGAVAGKTSQNSIAGVECDPKKIAGSAGKYVRYQDLTDQQDIKEYDLGRMEIAVVDVPDQLQNQAIGELWVSYTVKLGTPKLVVGRGLAIQQDLHGIVFREEDTLGPHPTEIIFAPQNSALNQCNLWANGKDVGLGRELVAPQNNIGTMIDGTQGVPLAQGGTSNFTRFIAISWTHTSPLPAMGFIKITFPGQYSGDVEINYECIINHMIGLPARSTALGAIQMFHDGNITAIEDMFVGTKPTGQEQEANESSAGKWSMCMAISDGGTTPGSTCISCPRRLSMTCHVNVSQATKGWDNIVYMGHSSFVTGTSPGNLTDSFVLQAECTIKEYNSGFRNAKGMIPWENEQTGVPIIQP